MTNTATIPVRSARWASDVLAWDLLAPVLVSLAISVAFIARTAFILDGVIFFTLMDDAMVSMRYARNLVNGHGFVWNPGQAPVEGYSNLLWTLWMAAVHALRLPQPFIALAIMVSGALLLAANVAVIYGGARSIAPTMPHAATLAAWFVALSYPLIFWTLRGMEVGLVTLLISIALVLALRWRSMTRPSDLRLLAVVMALSLLTRTDTLIPMATIAGFVVVASPPGQRRRTGLILASTVIGTLALHTMLRLLYYGDPFPNTYYLKVAGIDLTTRAARGIAVLHYFVTLHLWLPLLCASIAVLPTRGRVGGERLLLAAIVLGHGGYSVYVGGDAWEWMPHVNRYLTPALPALFILCGLSIAALRRHWHRGWRRVIARCAPIFLIIFINWEAYALWLIGGAAHARDDAAMVQYGKALAEATAPEATIAVVWAGAIPYVADRTAIDLLGKTDPVVARAAHRPVAQPPYLGGTGFFPGHSRWDYDWSVRQARPDVIAQVYHLTDDDRRAFAAWGYEAVAPGVYVQAGTSRVDRARLAAAAAAVPRRLREINLACDLLAYAPADQRPALEAGGANCPSGGLSPPSAQPAGESPVRP